MTKLLGERVMDAYIKLIMHRRAASVTAKLFHIWDVFHCQRIPSMSQEMHRGSHILEMAASLTANELVMFPMVVKRGKVKHWILLVMNNNRKMFQVLDSLWDISMYPLQIHKMVSGISSILGTTEVLSWDVNQVRGIPTQRDGCFVWALCA